MAETRAEEQITFFDRARSFAAAALIAAGLAAIVGAFLDWVVITPPPTIPDDQVALAQPYSGIDAGDGWFVVIIGVLLVVCGIVLGLSKRGGFARIAFILSIVLGGIAFANYRAVGAIDSDITRRMDLVGEPDPGVGILLVAVAALIALVGAVAGIAATPRERPSR